MRSSYSFVLNPFNFHENTFGRGRNLHFIGKKTGPRVTCQNRMKTKKWFLPWLAILPLDTRNKGCIWKVLKHWTQRKENHHSFDNARGALLGRAYRLSNLILPHAIDNVKQCVVKGKEQELVEFRTHTTLPQRKKRKAESKQWTLFFKSASKTPGHLPLCLFKVKSALTV